MSVRQRIVALRHLRDALAGDLPLRGQPLRHRIGREGSDVWSGVLALARELSVTAPLFAAVREAAHAVPASVAEELRQSHLENTLRNVRLRQQLTQAAEALNADGIVPLLFKGSLQLVDGTLAGVGDRSMIDLDLLVPGDQLQAADEALRGLGYAPDPGKPFLHPHELPFLRARAAGPIELHVELGSPPIPSVLPAAEAWADSSELPFGDAVARALSPTHQVLNNILHSAVQDLDHAVGALPLRQLLTLSQLVRTHGSAVDWAEIDRRMELPGLGGELRDHLWLAHRVAGMPRPDASRRVRPRVHEARVLASFALGWPADVQRNLRFAFGRAYLDSLYEHGDRSLKLTEARIRHAAHLVRRDGRSVLTKALGRKP
jgi:hypothetical protein